MLRIVKKGGLYGKCASLYVNDPVKASQYIIECSEQCNKEMALNYWGKQLTKDIVNYKTMVCG